MIIVRTLIGTALATLAAAIFKAMIDANMSQGGAVIFMLFTVAMIALTLRLPLPSTSTSSPAKAASPRHRS